MSLKSSATFPTSKWIDDIVLQIMALPPNRRIDSLPILVRLRTTVEALRLTTARVIVARYGSN